MIKNILFILTMITLLNSCQKDNVGSLTQSNCFISKETFPNFIFSFEPDSNISFDSIPCEYIEYEYDKIGKLQKRVMYRQLGISTPTNYYYRKLTRTILDSIIYDVNGLPLENFHSEPTIMRHEKFYYNEHLLRRIDFIIYNKVTYSNWTNYDEIGYEELFYDSNQKLIKSEYNLKKASSSTSEKTVRAYSYVNNNLFRVDYYKNFVDTSNTIGYELYENYDSKKNPYQYLFFLSDKRKYSLSNNNFQSRRYYYKTDYSESSGNLKYEYKGYNELGYPTDYPYGFLNITITYKN